MEGVSKQPGNAMEVEIVPMVKMKKIVLILDAKVTSSNVTNMNGILYPV